MNTIRTLIKEPTSDAAYFTKREADLILNLCNVNRGGTWGTIFENIPGWSGQPHAHNAPGVANLKTILKVLKHPVPIIAINVINNVKVIDAVLSTLPSALGTRVRSVHTQAVADTYVVTVRFTDQNWHK